MDLFIWIHDSGMSSDRDEMDPSVSKESNDIWGELRLNCKSTINKFISIPTKDVSSDLFRKIVQMAL